MPSSTPSDRGRRRETSCQLSERRDPAPGEPGASTEQKSEDPGRLQASRALRHLTLTSTTSGRSRPEGESPSCARPGEGHRTQTRAVTTHPRMRRISDSARGTERELVGLVTARGTPRTTAGTPSRPPSSSGWRWETSSSTTASLRQPRRSPFTSSSSSQGSQVAAKRSRWKRRQRLTWTPVTQTTKKCSTSSTRRPSTRRC